MDATSYVARKQAAYGDAAREEGGSLLKKPKKTSEPVIPAQTGIQHITDFVVSNILDPCFRQGDESFFNKLLGLL